MGRVKLPEIKKLRLTKCANTVVGTAGLVKGISGGERKRTNVALSLLSNPSLLLMDVYNAFAGLVNPAVPNKLFSTVNALDANAAAKAFYEFKDVVKAAQ